MCVLSAWKLHFIMVIFVFREEYKTPPFTLAPAPPLICSSFCHTEWVAGKRQDWQTSPVPGLVSCWWGANPPGDVSRHAASLRSNEGDCCTSAFPPQCQELPDKSAVHCRLTTNDMLTNADISLLIDTKRQRWSGCQSFWGEKDKTRCGREWREQHSGQEGRGQHSRKKMLERILGEV